jgi:amino acid transporter
MPSSRGAASPVATVTAGSPTGLSTFAGVFTPSILTILGVIMYLRFGWVVGSVGLLGTLLIVTLSTSITFLTALSVAAIATDQRVRTGGAYYMISRSLGLETGGAVGIPLFLAQGLSVALYTVGFAESVVGVFPSLSIRWVGVAVTVAVAALALVSAKAAIRAQYVIMAAIALSLVSLAAGGGAGDEPMGVMGAPVAEATSFWQVFAVFFPAVTGIMAGVNMSGDLKTPGKSIPRGTFAAIGTGYAIYMLLPILLATRASAETLVSDPLVMRRMAVWGDAILLGVWGATLSSAVGSILGAPRVLQALARDGVIPRPFSWLGRGSGPDDEPRIGTMATLVLALVAVWFGDLNVIAPVLTMFFLTTYGVLNVAAGLERFIGSPSFRPRFKVHWAFSLLGAVGCVWVMLLINALATAVAAALVLVIFLWLERRGLQAAWGDVRRGIWMALTRAGLLRLTRDSDDPRNWRPHILVLSGAPQRRWHLVEIADALSHSRGLVTVSTVVPEEAVDTARRRTLENNIQEFMAKRGVQGLTRVMPAPTYLVGAKRLVEAYGLGPLSPNTFLLGASQQEQDRDAYCALLEHLYLHRRNVVVVRDDETEGFRKKERIDIWWGGLKGNGSLLMILGYLLRSSLAWRGAEVRLKMVVPSEKAAEGARANLAGVATATRTGLRPQVLVANDRPFRDILRESSTGADLVLMGMRAPTGDERYVEYYQQLQEQTRGLPMTLFVLAAEEVAFRDVLFREPED